MVNKDIGQSFRALNIKWKDSLNRSRVLDTLLFIKDRASSKLGSSSLRSELLIGEIPTALTPSLKIFYAPIPHTRQYANVRTLVLGVLKSSFTQGRISTDERKGLDELIASATKYFNTWRETMIDEVVIIKKKANPTQGPSTKELTSKEFDFNRSTLRDLTDEEALALEAPLALQTLMDSPNSAQVLNKMNLNPTDKDRSLYADESDNKFDELSFLNDRYPVLGWFLLRKGYDGVSKSYSNATKDGVPGKDVDRTVRNDIGSAIKQQGASSVLENLLKQAAGK